MEEKTQNVEVVEEKNKVSRKTTSKVEKNTKKTWKEVFTENYNGTSEEAKMLKPHLKETYKGDVYIPWAVMERLTYMCDENAEFKNIENENGGFVFTDTIENHQVNIQNGTVISETRAPLFSHFVKVSLDFMGKHFIETYPIQDQDYTAARIYNQNLVNRALQRAKAKVVARATGLGLRLYEGFDLQFEEDKTNVKPVIPDVKPTVLNVSDSTKKVEEVVNNAPEVKPEVKEEIKPEAKEEPKVVEEIKTNAPVESETTLNTTPEIAETIKLIKTTDVDKMTKILQMINVSIMKKYMFALSVNDTEEELANKLSKFPNVEQFKKSLENFIK